MISFDFNIGPFCPNTRIILTRRIKVQYYYLSHDVHVVIYRSQCFNCSQLLCLHQATRSGDHYYMYAIPFIWQRSHL